MSTGSVSISLFKEGRFSHMVHGSLEHVVIPTVDSWDGEYVYGEFDDAYWLDSGQPRKRQPCPVAVDGLWLRDVCPGSTITIEKQQYECTEGGDVELSFQYPGVYVVTVSCWPYLDGEYEIENTPQAE